METKKIVIATGIYPPEVGGPAYYAQSLRQEFEALGHTLKVLPFRNFKLLPSGIRHIAYAIKLFFVSRNTDAVIALDTFSVGVPAGFVARVSSTPVIIRTGGDFLWEEYIERTGEKILLSDFYTKKRDFSFKENLILRLTKWALQSVNAVIFSTEYQRAIFKEAYSIEEDRTAIIENHIPQQYEGSPPAQKNFVCFVRDRLWKNLDVLREAFSIAKRERDDITLEIETEIPREEVLTRLKDAYAVILVSLGDISPNFVLEALSFCKPVILTEETGLKDTAGDRLVLVDPLDPDAIAEKILWLADEVHYQEQAKKVSEHYIPRSYTEIAHDFLNIINQLSP